MSYYANPTHQDSTNHPILIVDRVGVIGSALYDCFRDSHLVVLLSNLEPDTSKNLVYVPLNKRQSKVPNSVYSSIFCVLDPEKHSLDIVKDLFHKAQKDNSRFILILAKDSWNDKLVKSALLYHGCFVFLLGDLFNAGPKYSKQFMLDSLIQQAKSTGEVRLQSSGLIEIHPVQFIDVISTITSTLQKNHSGALFYLLPKTPASEISIARILQKVEPMIRPVFANSNKNKNHAPFDSEQVKGEWMIKDDYPWEEKLQKAFKEFTPELSISHSSKVQKNGKPSYFQSSPRKLKVKPLGLTLFAFVIVFLLPMPASISASLLALNLLNSSKAQLEQGSLTPAKQNAFLSSSLFSFAYASLNLYSPLIDLLKLNQLTNPLRSQLLAGQSASDGLSQISSAALALQSIYQNKSANPRDTLLQSTADIKTALNDLQKLKSSSNLPASYQEKIDKIYPTALAFSNFVDLLPTLAGSTTEKKYLILFQNNMELRPNGGFIGSYALLKVKSAKVETFVLNDVYTADGQLRGHVEPPFAIRRYIPQIHLYLRDSNWDLDFSKSAPTIANLFSQETGEKIDGIISIDLSFVKDIIASVGQVYIPEYNVTINKDNFYLFTQQHAEQKFFPGSTQKSNFLKAVFAALESKLESRVSYSSLATALAQAVSQKHLLFAFQDTPLQDVFTANNLSSTLWDNRISSQKNFNDTIGLNEANLGGNKVNFLLKRQIAQEVHIDPSGSVSGQLTISYHNTSDGTWPGGNYTNYSRLIVPQNASLTGISIDGKQQKLIPAITDPKIYEKPGFKKPTGLEIEKYDEEQKTIYGFLTTVASNSAQTVIVNYTLAQKAPISSDSFVYNLQVIKQPGTDKDPYSLTISYPPGFSILNQPSSGEASYNSILDTDKSYQINFIKK